MAEKRGEGRIVDVRALSPRIMCSDLPFHLCRVCRVRACVLQEGDDATKMFARKIAELYPDYRYADRTLMEVWGRKGDKRKVYRLHVLRKGRHAHACEHA
jgi:hypothetical protein